MLSVVLGRTTPVYSPGDTLSGDVVINATTQYSILDLTVNYCGISSVSFLWSEGEGKSRTCEKVEESDIHLDVLHPLVKSYRGLVIESGVHTYSFSLQLPRHLPSSYKSLYGQVDYYVHVHLQTSANTFDVRKVFVIRAPVNINLFPASKSPRSAEVTKKYGLITIKTLRMKACLSKTCFVPGDIIPILIEVNNETCRQLRYLFCTLKQVTNVLVHLQDKAVNRVTKQCVITVAHKLVDGKGHHSWLCQLPSPSQLIPTIAASSIILVTYSIQVSAKIRGVAIPPELQIPIVFGISAPITTQHTSVHSEPSDINRTRRISHHQPLPTIHQRRRSFAIHPPSSDSVFSKEYVTDTNQPQNSYANTARQFTTHLQSIASDLRRCLSSHLLPTFTTPRHFSFES